MVWEAASLFEERSFQTLLEDVQQRVEAGCFPRIYFVAQGSDGVGKGGGLASARGGSQPATVPQWRGGSVDETSQHIPEAALNSAGVAF